MIDLFLFIGFFCESGTLRVSINNCQMQVNIIKISIIAISGKVLDFLNNNSVHFKTC